MKISISKYFPLITLSVIIIEEYGAKRGSSRIWFISRKMAKQDFVYHCWPWPAVTLKWLLHMLWISHHYETFTECRNEDSVAEIYTNSIFMICGLDPLLALYSSISVEGLCCLYGFTVLHGRLSLSLPHWNGSVRRERMSYIIKRSYSNLGL